MPARFADRAVIVTGASAGIGRACARRFVAEGARVLIVARGEAGLREAAAELGARGTVVVHAGEVQRAVVERALAELGGIDILVNNAACNPRGPLEDHEPEALGRAIDLNLRAPVMLTRRVLPHLRSAGRGAIVHVASLAGRVPLPHEAVYSASKFGLRAFSLALAEELRGSGITVSVVSPGPVETGFILDDLDHVPDIVLSQPMSTAEEVAERVLACAADGRPERALPRLGAALSTVGYLAPALGRALRPLLALQGRRNRRRYRSRA
jgi:short-subunit dehydrogenase